MHIILVLVFTRKINQLLTWDISSVAVTPPITKALCEFLSSGNKLSNNLSVSIRRHDQSNREYTPKSKVIGRDARASLPIVGSDWSIQIRNTLFAISP